MNNTVMRDVFIEEIYSRMHDNNNIFFISADFGAPALDKLRNEFEDRFINVGIAEQNLVNVATGLALEGYVVYAYAIAPFLTMRAYEQIRSNLSIMSQVRPVNVNMIGVGAGLSYDVTGPTHHCLEDIGIMRALPNLEVFSPADHITIENFIDYSLQVKKPKYIRLDGKAQPKIYESGSDISMKKGFYELQRGNDLCIVSTGYMTHKALKVAAVLKTNAISAAVVDVFMLKPLDEELLSKTLSKYPCVFTMEEAFINKGGLDAIILNMLRKTHSYNKIKAIGFEDHYVFDVGNREYLHKVNGLDVDNIVQLIKETIQG